MQSVSFKLAEGFHIVPLNCSWFLEGVSNNNHYVTRWSLLESHLLMTSTYAILNLKVSEALYYSTTASHYCMSIILSLFVYAR